MPVVWEKSPHFGMHPFTFDSDWMANGYWESLRKQP